ncbi:MAG: hypothetical protein PVSMB6_09140 [Steroidobacteraceae bacterium]
MNLLQHLTRVPFVLGLWSRVPLGSVQTRVLYGVFPYAQYAYGVYWSAMSAARLGIPRISVMELGVAGGRGLLALERASAEIERDLGVGIDVFGFDSGEGLPEPCDYRDLPHIWGHGFYEMNVPKLRARLTRAQLLLGEVGETTRHWLQSGTHAPIGFVGFDLDYYSSTRSALALFEGAEATHLPRVYCYFDDVAATDLGCMNDQVGELLAIREFNEQHTDRRISRIEQLRVNRMRWEPWQERMFAFHDFGHSRYNTLVIPRTTQGSQAPL